MKSWRKLPDVGSKAIPTHGVRYRAFELVKPEEVKVVVLAQDPYPTRGHANGLAFSVCPHVKKLPPTLRNIYNEYASDLGFAIPSCGDLTPWAERGVLLLNTALTTIEGERGAHLDKWKDFTYETIRWVSGLPGRRVWLLWGAEAQAYEEVIYKGEKADGYNAVIKTSHPSPLSANHSKHSVPFIGSKCFSLAAEFLKEKKEFWRLP